MQVEMKKPIELEITAKINNKSEKLNFNIQSTLP